MFDFLRDTVSKVLDLGGSDAAAEDTSAAKRRKISEDEEDGNDECTAQGRSPASIPVSVLDLQDGSTSKQGLMEDGFGKY